ncbi:MAG TPA: hypothetical protein VJH65_00445 [Candidatus Nanoarchaeia archaeon]|nr:hypothetical protein [Candidatus Nanoarchaeia archaeon]
MGNITFSLEGTSYFVSEGSLQYFTNLIKNSVKSALTLDLTSAFSNFKMALGYSTLINHKGKEGPFDKYLETLNNAMLNEGGNLIQKIFRNKKELPLCLEEAAHNLSDKIENSNNSNLVLLDHIKKDTMEVDAPKEQEDTKLEMSQIYSQEIIYGFLKICEGIRKEGMSRLEKTVKTYKQILRNEFVMNYNGSLGSVSEISLKQFIKDYLAEDNEGYLNSIKSLQKTYNLGSYELRNLALKISNKKQRIGLIPRPTHVTAKEALDIWNLYHTKNNNGKRLTIEEILDITGRNKETIYRTLHKLEKGEYNLSEFDTEFLNPKKIGWRRKNTKKQIIGEYEVPKEIAHGGINPTGLVNIIGSEPEPVRDRIKSFEQVENFVKGLN